MSLAMGRANKLRDEAQRQGQQLTLLGKRTERVGAPVLRRPADSGFIVAFLMLGERGRAGRAGWGCLETTMPGQQ